jgi:RNA polymerase-binding transcription factor DksA
MNTLLPLPTMEALCSRLACEREQIRGQIAELRTAEGLDAPRDAIERREEVTHQAEQRMDLAEWDRMGTEEWALSDRLMEVEHALAKILVGAYGLCEACGAPIPEAWLWALPAAPFDIVHETALERSLHTE